jgi:hypothetical protein
MGADGEVQREDRDTQDPDERALQTAAREGQERARVQQVDLRELLADPRELEGHAQLVDDQPTQHPPHRAVDRDDPDEERVGEGRARAHLLEHGIERDHRDEPCGEDDPRAAQEPHVEGGDAARELLELGVRDAQDRP